jgi:hypothetical protein
MQGQQVARGQRGTARALKDAVEKAPGLAGWPMRRADS